MNIYLISQSVNNGWDTYDSAVVVAKSPADAQTIHPSGRPEPTRIEDSDDSMTAWCAQYEVKIEEIGVIFEGQERGVVCASFNAG